MTGRAGAAPARPVTPYVGNKLTELHAGRGGFAHILPPLGGEVKAGELVATISDPFGRIIESVHAPVSGRVNTIATDPLRDPGDMLMRIVFVSPDPACAAGC